MAPTSPAASVAVDRVASEGTRPGVRGAARALRGAAKADASQSQGLRLPGKS